MSGTNNCNPCPPPHTRKPKPCSETVQKKSQWRRVTGDYKPSADLNNCLARHKQTTIFWLRTGHCSLLVHLKWMDITFLDCKEAEQTVHHILQDCSVWWQQRHQLWAAGWVNHQQAVGNGGRPVPHHPVPGNMWTEVLALLMERRRKRRSLFVLLWYEWFLRINPLLLCVQTASFPRIFKLFRGLGLRHLVVVNGDCEVSTRSLNKKC